MILPSSASDSGRSRGRVGRGGEKMRSSEGRVGRGLVLDVSVSPAVEGVVASNIFLLKA